MASATQLPWDKIIGAAAASTLGVLSLCVILIGVLAYLFFGRSDDRIKLWVFGAILLAVIGLAIAVLRESGGTAHEPVPSGSGTASPPAGPGPGPEPSPAAATGKVATADEPRAKTAAASPATSADQQVAVSDLSGKWRDDDGYIYNVTAVGDGMSYDQMMNGQRVGHAAGTISGRTLTYRFVVDRTGDDGMCHAQVAAGNDSIDGTCSDGTSSWNFRIVRAASRS